MSYFLFYFFFDYAGMGTTTDTFSILQQYVIMILVGHFLNFLVPKGGLEPPCPQGTPDFEYEVPKRVKCLLPSFSKGYPYFYFWIVLDYPRISRALWAQF
jgi:hypothetical protein